MLSKSANPSLATPSQAPRGEGVETGWEPPDRVGGEGEGTVQTTNARESGGESRSGTGSGESWFEPRRGNWEAVGDLGLLAASRSQPLVCRKNTPYCRKNSLPQPPR